MNSNSVTEHKTDMNITKYKKLNMTEQKTNIAITKIDKYKKLNNNSSTSHKINILNTKTDHDGTQNRHEHYQIQNLNMTKHKADMKITEKLNRTSTAEYKTDMNMTEKLSSTFTEHNYTLVNQTINIRKCLQVVLIRLSDFMIAVKVLLTSSTLV